MDKNKQTQLFNHHKALKTSHGDEGIAIKLRHMFINDLTTQLEKAKKLWIARDITELQSQLHHILGGAQVCAAEALCVCILEMKAELKNTHYDVSITEGLWDEINQISQLMQELIVD